MGGELGSPGGVGLSWRLELEFADRLRKSYVDVYDPGFVIGGELLWQGATSQVQAGLTQRCVGLLLA